MPDRLAHGNKQARSENTVRVGGLPVRGRFIRAKHPGEDVARQNHRHGERQFCTRRQKSRPFGARASSLRGRGPKSNPDSRALRQFLDRHGSQWLLRDDGVPPESGQDFWRPVLLL